MLIGRVASRPDAAVTTVDDRKLEDHGSGHDSQGPAPAGELAGDRGVGDDAALLPDLEPDPAVVEPLVAGMPSRPGGNAEALVDSGTALIGRIGAGRMKSCR